MTKTEISPNAAPVVGNVLQRVAGGISENYVHGANLLATADTHYITDPLGTPLRAVNHTGESVAVMAYDEFGVPATTGNQHAAFGFTGYENDPVSGMMYAKARYYNPGTGRFISQDAVMGALLVPEAFNGYLYATNRPTRYTDKNGLFLNVLVGAIVGTVVNVVSTVAVSVVTGQGLPSGEALLGAAVGGAVGGAVMGAMGPFAFTPMGSGIVGGVTSGVSTPAANLAENATGKADHSFGDILVNTAISTGIGFGVGWVVGAAGDKLAQSVGRPIGIPGINAGSHSFGQVFKSGMTRLFNGTAHHMSLQVIGKGIVYMFVDGFAGSLIEEGAGKVSDCIGDLIGQMQAAKTPAGKYDVLFGEQVNPAWVCVQ